MRLHLLVCASIGLAVVAGPACRQGEPPPTPVAEFVLAAQIQEVTEEVLAPTPSPTPEPTPVPTPRPTRAPQPVRAAGVVTPLHGDDVWLALAACESTGDRDGRPPHRINKRAYSPKGPYYGALQWLMSTWRSAGGTGDPRDASLEEEIARGKAWLAKTSWRQWPSCSRALGLR